MLAGLVLQMSALIFLGAIILVINIVQSAQGGRHDFEEESFMGYDFSQGYTSLERSSGGGSPETRKSKWQRWKEDRQKQQAEQERERQLQDEAQLDALLAKVHEHGMDSLSFAEKRLPQRVSTKYRDRTKREPSGTSLFDAAAGGFEPAVLFPISRHRRPGVGMMSSMPTSRLLRPSTAELKHLTEPPLAPPIRPRLTAALSGSSEAGSGCTFPVA